MQQSRLFRLNRSFGAILLRPQNISLAPIEKRRPVGAKGARKRNGVSLPFVSPRANRLADGDVSAFSIVIPAIDGNAHIVVFNRLTIPAVWEWICRAPT